MSHAHGHPFEELRRRRLFDRWFWATAPLGELLVGVLAVGLIALFTGVPAADVGDVAWKLSLLYVGAVMLWELVVWVRASCDVCLKRFMPWDPVYISTRFPEFEFCSEEHYERYWRRHGGEY